MTKSQNLKFNAIENTDAIVGIDIAKNVHWAGIILPNGKEIKKSFSFHNNRKGFESLVETVKNVLTMLNFKQAIVAVIGKILQIIYAVITKNEKYKTTRVFTQERLEQLKVA